jgi:hypothetical protein
MPAEPHFNPSPDPVFRRVDELRRAMCVANPAGDRFLDYLLAGRYGEGKGVWINDTPAARAFYAELLAANPHLASESPFAEDFRKDEVRTRGGNRIILRALADAPPAHQALVAAHHAQGDEVALFSGGPAAKTAALLCALPAMAKLRPLAVRFVLDGAEQSNESGSASYEHINHANALNAELDNTGIGILLSAMSRAIFGEPNPDVALSVLYKKVDLWPRAISLRDIPIYLGNELHGIAQTLRGWFGLATEHTKSRLASKRSTAILTYLERELGCPFRLDNQKKRAIFLYFAQSHYRLSLRDNAELRRDVGLEPQALSREQLVDFYGGPILDRVVGADLFPENACIRHGFDAICRAEMEKLGIDYLHRRRIAEIYLDGGRAAGVAIENVRTGEVECIAVDYLGLSLGPSATYHFAGARTMFDRLRGAFSIGLPVPYQTIATGLTAQILFRITDAERARQLPFTGMKQTHFVEIGRTATHVLVKLTCGGVIGLPVYSRSYGISALASILRVLTPDTGLRFEDVICAWPCARGINPSNNGQIVRLADNAVARFAEGGTGMSKMGSNAQTMLDLLELPWPAPTELRTPGELYEHTIIDRRGAIARRIHSGIEETKR